MTKRADLIIPCDKCGSREATWTCTECEGLFCPDDVQYVRPTEKHPMGQVLCLKCYPEHHDQGEPVKLNERNFSRVKP